MIIKIFKDGTLITEGLDLKNGKALPGGWSQYEIYHEGKKIGWLESGNPSNLIEGYTFTEKKGE